MHTTNSSAHIRSNQLQKPLPINIVLVGSGIVSVTLATFLMLLEPNWIIHIYERLKKPAQESSNAWNNAGTGHAAYCELNYTTYNHNTNDSIDISKAITVNEAFETSLQFWTYLVKLNILNNPSSFINRVPHMSFVWGEKNVQFLKKRYEALKNQLLFNDMLYSDDPQHIRKWAPLIIDGRSNCQKIAATRMETGTDINFGEITEQSLMALKKHPNFKIYLNHEVTKIQYHNNDIWKTSIINLSNHQKKYIYSNYVFIGAGGKSLTLLQTTGIDEITGYAGFPIGGQFLVTKNPKIINQHFAKVYGKASINTPPMSVPHIDTRILNGKKILLFGPFATFSSKFLKNGSWLDLFHSLNKHNILSILQVGMDNFELIKYIINQLMMSHHKRIEALKEYYPTVNSSDWSLLQAGQRVQIIKKNSKNRGILQFGTEIISAHNGTISALLGASPGASTVASIILEILHKMFYNKIHSDLWKKKITEMIPSYLNQLHNNFELMNKIRQNIYHTLQLTIIEPKK